jgi:hypothetical protein
MKRILRIHADTKIDAGNPRPSAKSAPSAFYLVFLIAVAALLLVASPVAAQEDHRAGLVIVHGDGSVVTQCVAFTEATISGADLLARSGLDMAVEASSMGATICRLDGEGCDFPAETCFCQCQGSPCVYWSYWRLNDGVWQYSNGGAGNTTVRDGAVDGWRWGLGTVDAAEPPPDITFADICGVEETPAAAVAASPALEATGVQTTSSLRTETTPLATANPAPAPTTMLAPRTALIVLAGILVALPLIAFLVAWGWRVRQRGK